MGIPKKVLTLLALLALPQERTKTTFPHLLQKKWSFFQKKGNCTISLHLRTTKIVILKKKFIALFILQPERLQNRNTLSYSAN